MYSGEKACGNCSSAAESGWPSLSTATSRSITLRHSLLRSFCPSVSIASTSGSPALISTRSSWLKSATGKRRLRAPHGVPSVCFARTLSTV